LGDRKGIRPVKKLDVGLFMVTVIASAATTNSIILSYNEIYYGDILVPAKPVPGPHGKLYLKRREKHQTSRSYKERGQRPQTLFSTGSVVHTPTECRWGAHLPS